MLPGWLNIEGFPYAAPDLGGYQTGSMNKTLQLILESEALC